LVRGFNEDHFLVARLSRRLETLVTNVPDRHLPDAEPLDGYILAVADGLGGHAAGAHASRLVIRTGLELILSSANWALRMSEAEAARLIMRMRDYFIEIDRSLLHAVRQDKELSGMATTLTVAYTTGLHAFAVHVGDSRIYRSRDGKLEQITRDHTVVQTLVESGHIRADQAPQHSKRHVLTNVLCGHPEHLKPEVTAFDLQDRDLLLVCSDGLHDLVGNHIIAEALSGAATPDAACDALIERALRSGGRDNVSVIVARYTT
jgi:protein phosphatase